MRMYRHDLLCRRPMSPVTAEDILGGYYSVGQELEVVLL